MICKRAEDDALFPSPGHAVLITAAGLVLQMAVGGLIGLIAAITAGADRAQVWVRNPWLLGAANLIALGAPIWFVLARAGSGARDFFRSRAFSARLLVPIALCAVGLSILLHATDDLLVRGISRLTGIPPVEADLLAVRPYPLGALLTMVVIAPVTEEYLFRRLLLHGLLRQLAPWAAILSSATLFGIMHANLRQFIVGLFYGTLAGFWYQRTRSVWPGIVGHALFNLMAWLAVLDPAFPGDRVVFLPEWRLGTAAVVPALIGGALLLFGLAGSLHVTPRPGVWRRTRAAGTGEPPLLPSLTPPLLAEPVQRGAPDDRSPDS